MKIATFNANSIRTRMPVLLPWLAQHRPDILGIQETKVQDADFPFAPLQDVGYHVIFRGEKSYNGVAMLSLEPPKEVRFGFDDGGPVDETRLMRARIGEVFVVNTYVPQGRAIDHVMYRYKLAWYERLLRLFKREYASDTPLAWIGDINIAVDPLDVANPQTKQTDPCFHADARAAFRAVCAFGFTDLFRTHHPEEAQYSFFDYRVRDAVERNIGWRIDYILATAPLAARCTACDIDLEPRRAEKPSDHTFMVAEFL